MCVILAGAPWEGFKVYGPFSDGIEAEQYQSERLHARCRDCGIVYTFTPEECDECDG